MKSTHRILTLACVAAVLAGAPVARAQEQAPPAQTTIGSPSRNPYIKHSENQLRTRKFFRGLANVTLAVTEIPNQAFQQAHRTRPFPGAIVGAGKGLVKGVKRFGVGLFEMATFYAPINKYQPYIEPEVVFMEHLH